MRINQGVSFGSHIGHSLAIRGVRQAIFKHRANSSIQMRCAKIILPAMKAVGVTLAKGRHAALTCPQIEQHMRAHRAPPQARACPDGTVYILNAGNAFLDKMQCLSPQRSLQPVGDMPWHLLVDADGGLPDSSIEPFGSQNGFRRRALIPDKLDKWN